jgi:hypothetical protein
MKPAAMLVRGGLALIVLVAAWSAWKAYDLSVQYGTSNPCDMVAQRLADPYDLGSDRSRIIATMLTPGLRKDGAMACWGSMFFGIKTPTEVAYIPILEADEIANRWDAGGSGPDLAVMETTDATSEVLNLLLLRGQYELIRTALAESKRPDELREKLKVAIHEECSFVMRQDVCVANDLSLFGMSSASARNRPPTSFVEPKMVELKGGTFRWVRLSTT